MSIGVDNKKWMRSFYKKSLLFGLILVFFSSSLISISQLIIGTTKADSLSGKVINAETVEGPDRQLYFLSNGLCKSDYYPSGKSCLGLPKDVDYSKPENCFNFIAFTKESTFTDNTWYYHESRYIQPSADGRSPGTCEKKDKNGSWIPSKSGTFFAPTINMQNTDQLFTIYSWVNISLISRINTTIGDDNVPENSYSRSGNTNEYQENGVTCPDIITIDSSNPSKGSYIARSSQKGEDQAISWNSDGRFVYEKADQDSGPGCYATKSIGINIAYPENATKPAPSSDACAAASEAEKATIGCPSSSFQPDTASTTGDKCDDALNPFGWVFCPVLTAIDSFLTWIEGQLPQLLFMQSKYYNSSQLHEVWRNINNIASAAIVLIALIMIAGQIFNFEFISAYTIKKVLPRLVIAVILMQLSWFLCTTLIQFVNAIGVGIYAVLTAPFDISSSTTIRDLLSNSVGGIDNTGIFMAVITVTGFAAAGGISGLIGVSIIILAAILVAFVVLALRKVALVLLLVLAPIAILCWILPGTQKIWDQWWKMFSRLLLMFPLIMALLASGKIAASITADIGPNTSGGDSTINKLIIIVAYFAPFFLIPFTYSFAGGAFGKLAGSVNSLGKNWGKKGSEFGKQTAKDTTGRFARNHNNRFTRGLNNTMSGSLTRGQRARTAALSKKALDEQTQQSQALLEQQLYGKSHSQQLDLMRSEATKRGTRGDVAMSKLAEQGEWGDADGIGNIDIQRVQALARRDSAFAAKLWTNRRDLAEGGMGTIQNMNATQLASLADDSWQHMSTVPITANFSRQLETIRRTDTLRANLKGHGLDYVFSHTTPTATPPAGGPGPVPPPAGP